MRSRLFQLVEDLAAALVDDEVRGRQDAQEVPRLHPVVVVLASLLLAATIVVMTILIAMGLDALLRLDQQLDHDPGAWIVTVPAQVPATPPTAMSPVSAVRQSAARVRQRLRGGASSPCLAIGGVN